VDAVEDLVESVTRGNVTEVKVVLASVAVALGAYQLVLIAVGYGSCARGGSRRARRRRRTGRRATRSSS
jgi:hypothetical protein